MDWAIQSSWFDDQLAPWVQANAANKSIVALTVEAPVVDARALSRFEQVITFPDQSLIATEGIVEKIEADGSSRFADVKEKARQLFEQITSIGPKESNQTALKLMGGFSFTESTHTGKWSDFPNTLFWLPQFTYSIKDNQASLTCVTTHSNRQNDLKKLGEILNSLNEHVDTETIEPKPSYQKKGQQSTTNLSKNQWQFAVETVCGLIEKYEVSKVVLSRQKEQTLPIDFDFKKAFQRLIAKNKKGSHFRLQSKGSVFLGSSPEKLISKHGKHIETEAIAGTISCEVDDYQSKLQSSTKDLAEHRFVVDLIENILNKECEELEITGPTVKPLRHVAHLKSRFSGRLKNDAHILDLVSKLHPTPAMAGVPTPKALNTINELEPDSRGWYASPVGWFDANGDGEFSVAIRSALIKDSKATLFAGGGIVMDSCSEKEFNETELKFSTIQEVLGIDF